MLNVIQPWYEEGLRFNCTGCGQCCTGSPGYVWVSEEEMSAIANFMQISLQDFVRLYVRRVNGRFSLLEHPKNFDCVFLKDKKCQIYSVRPIQCRTFPWWPKNLKTKEDWQEAAQFCEGINIEAPLIPIQTIQEQLNAQEEANKTYV
jgi:uncharacterized protein